MIMNDLLISEKYKDNIFEYCKLNNIENINDFVNSCFKQGFDIKKYGYLRKDQDLKSNVFYIGTLTYLS